MTAIGARLGVVVIAACIVQLTVITHFGAFGVAPDLVPLMIAAIGLLAGAPAGAAAGFLAGLLIDAALLQVLGVSSLLLTIEGYVAGTLRARYDMLGRLAPVAVGAAAAAFFAVGTAVARFSLGAPAPAGVAVLAQTTGAVVFAAALALPTFYVTRRLLLDKLGDDDPVARRRRGFTVPYRFQPPRTRGR